jgi:hypothetical protein
MPPSGSASQRRVEPSMSVKRNVTVPVGRDVFRTISRVDREF